MASNSSRRHHPISRGRPRDMRELGTENPRASEQSEDTADPTAPRALCPENLSTGPRLGEARPETYRGRAVNFPAGVFARLSVFLLEPAKLFREALHAFVVVTDRHVNSLLQSVALRALELKRILGEKNHRCLLMLTRFELGIDSSCTCRSWC